MYPLTLYSWNRLTISDLVFPMDKFEKNIEIRWSDLDPNFHVLHSKYYDFGAFCRMAFFVESGLTPALMNKYNIGPILFREECIFKREITFGDQIMINFILSDHNRDYSRWSMKHEIWKNSDTLSAVIYIDGAWMDTIKRKLTVLPPEMHTIFERAPRGAGESI